MPKYKFNPFANEFDALSKGELNRVVESLQSGPLPDRIQEDVAESEVNPFLNQQMGRVGE